MAGPLRGMWKDEIALGGRGNPVWKVLDPECLRDVGVVPGVRGVAIGDGGAKGEIPLRSGGREAWRGKGKLSEARCEVSRSLLEFGVEAVFNFVKEFSGPLLFLGAVGLYFALQLWILPALGLPT